MQTVYNRSERETFVRDAHRLRGTIATGVSIPASKLTIKPL
jgi:hypothetical protein